jgi:hypothetical protein
MRRVSSAAVAIVLLSLPGLSVAAHQKSGPPLYLNRQRAHVRLYGDDAPSLAFYARRDLSGPPVIRVNEQGAFVGQTLVCSWPGGKYDPRNSSGMVLGYSEGSVEAPTYTGCPDGFPVISTWGDHGLGGAALFIEVFSRRGAIVEVRFRDQPLYFDLNMLPGDPRDEAPISSFRSVTADKTGLRPKGFMGWQWEIPVVEADRLRAVAAEKLRREPRFARFIRDVKACLSSSRVPGCFIPFVKDGLYYPEADPTAFYVTAAKFADYVWRQTDYDGSRLWNRLRECFVSGGLDAGDTAARLEGKQGWSCDLELTKKGWKLTGFLQLD